MKITKQIPAMLFSTAVLLTACNKEKLETTEEEANPREVSVNMTDAPGDYESLTVEIESVEIYSENSGWITLNNETQFVSVLELNNGKELELGSTTEAEVGAYSKLRITFGDEHKLNLNSTLDLEIGDIVISNNLLVDLKWDGPKAIEIEIDEEISASHGINLLIDFNVAQSIMRQGEEYVIRPVITEIKDRSTGLHGEIEGTGGAALVLTNGEDTLSTFTNAQGKFLIRGMQEGVYDLIIYPEAEEGKPLKDKERIEGVVITKGKIKSAGTIKF